MKKIFNADPFASSTGLFILRFFPSMFMLMAHGWPKLENYQERSQTFADPLGVGSETSLMLAIFAEVFCSILVILGLATRLALVPLIITMLVAVFIHHAGDPFRTLELGLMFLVVYFTLMFTGPGSYSVDGLISSNNSATK